MHDIIQADVTTPMEWHLNGFTGGASGREGHGTPHTVPILVLFPSPKTMASKISKSQQSFSETEKSNQNHPEVEDEQAPACPISSQLHLKPSVHSMDRDVILKRIRHHKRSNKVKNAFPDSGYISQAATESG
ncbi:hypothetical protein OIU77_003369 [Salix suchowensis]|uniref:Uncharacterized protein n=1 Tax=Salix suchowensis TaxID=1278906 RepID=A0ABQ9AZG3_9ROSI|nr:hypothetical protein OIU77_003369 [Salix suchowensis]